MPLDRDPASLLDVVTAAKHILEFTDRMDYAAFLADPKTQSAVVLQLLIIGEATKRLSADFKAAHAGIPWRSIARMRDKMIHHYEEVNYKEVWKAIQSDIPALLGSLQPFIPPQNR